MSFFHRGIAAAALMAALGACATAPEAAAPQQAAAPTKGVLEAALDAAGGQAALSAVKELEWTGKATINAGGKTTNVNVLTVLRPAGDWSRSTTWTDAEGQKKARTIQTEQGKGWTVNGVTWTPMPEAQAVHENQQFGLYKAMLLTSLSGATEDKVARTLKTQLHGGAPAELMFDASGKLTGATLTVRDAAGGADIKETVKFSGEIVSNGVKWPKQISITQNGAPYYDLEIATFEALSATKPRPMVHTLDDGQTPPQDRPSDAG